MAFRDDAKESIVLKRATYTLFMVKGDYFVVSAKSLGQAPLRITAYEIHEVQPELQLVALMDRVAASWLLLYKRMEWRPELATFSTQTTFAI